MLFSIVDKYSAPPSYPRIFWQTCGSAFWCDRILVTPASFIRVKTIRGPPTTAFSACRRPLCAGSKYRHRVLQSPEAGNAKRPPECCRHLSRCQFPFRCKTPAFSPALPTPGSRPGCCSTAASRLRFSSPFLRTAACLPFFD